MLETSLFVASIAFLGMLSPGPDFFLVIKNAARYPRVAALMTSFGGICGVITHMSYCVAGLAVVITTTPWLFDLLKYVGAAYLIWVGIQALFSRSNSKMNLDGLEPQQVKLRTAFVQGYLCNLVNPKATLFFGDVYPGLADRLQHRRKTLVCLDHRWPFQGLGAFTGLLIQSAPGRSRLAKEQKDMINCWAVC